MKHKEALCRQTSDAPFSLKVSVFLGLRTEHPTLYNAVNKESSTRNHHTTPTMFIHTGKPNEAVSISGCMSWK